MNIVYLKEKRDECCAKLCQYTASLYTKKFLSIYELTKKNNKKPRMLLKEFQHAVREISQWSAEDIKQEHDRFRSSYDSFDGIVRSIFKLHLAIYNAAHDSAFDACIPNAGQYMHETYLNIARILWKEPFLVYDVKVSKQDYMKNMVRLEKITKKCLLETFVFMLPFKEFDEQLAEESDTDYSDEDVDSEDEDVDSEDEDVADEDADVADEDEDVADEDADVADEDEDVADEDEDVADEDEDVASEDEDVADEDEDVASEDAEDVASEDAEDAPSKDDGVVESEVADIAKECESQKDVVVVETCELPHDTTPIPSPDVTDLCTPLTKSIDLSADEEPSETEPQNIDDPNLRVVNIVEKPQRRTLSERKKLVKEIVKKRGFPDFAKPRDSFF